MPRPRRKRVFPKLYASPAARGRKGGKHNAGRRRRGREQLRAVLLDIMNRKPQPPFSEIQTIVRRRCSWSHFDYELFTKVYLPRWRRGNL